MRSNELAGSPAAIPALALADRYRNVRALTERLAAPLTPEDQTVQSMPDVSPTKWHRAHATWFFETFLLRPHLAGYREFDPQFGFLFNSYYEGVGARYPRTARGIISRPGVAQISAYRSYVDRHMFDLMGGRAGSLLDVSGLVELGLHHEQQHQELLLMDIKHVLSRNPAFPAYDPAAAPAPQAQPSRVEWRSFTGGISQIGHVDGEGFAFDNETPSHRVFLEPFRIATRLVTCREWMAFIAAGGYCQPALWLSDGWHAARTEEWDAPLYWHKSDDQWFVYTLSGLQPVNPDHPVMHVSYYEADAFARWAGARLPTEFEWEHAAPSLTTGQLWEWTASAYLPYPGFVPAAGAVGEYNGKFMSNQMVLRGGCFATPPGHIRRTYRNFFYPGQRWMFGGLRLAGSA